MGFREDDEHEEPTNPNLATQPNVNPVTNLASFPDLGLLNLLIQDPEITEIMVNDLRNIAIEKRGQIIVTPVRFKNIEELNRIIRNILEGSGRAATFENPLVTTSLPDGSRVHIVVPPVSEHGPCITIRRFPKRYSIEQLIGASMMSNEMAYFLNACVLGKQNILVSGGTGTGKTTLLNSLIALIPPHERVITIEDSAEIPLILPNQVKMMTKIKSASSEAISARELVTNALRMRPDRIIVGEVRSSEALDMIQAMNTGHQGSMTTVHANTARDALFRLETLAMSTGYDIPLQAIRRQISGALQLIVQIRRFRSGVRKIVSIQEITGMEQDTILLQEVFSFIPSNPNDYYSDEGTFQYNTATKTAENLKLQGIKPLP